MISAGWYAAGLRFGCTRCGTCCRGGGVVEVSDADIERMAAHLGLDESLFRERHTRPLRKGRIRLQEQRGGACIFLRAGKGCSVYENRPAQCRSYPFWPSILVDRESWQAESVRCPGIDAPAAPLIAKSAFGLALERVGEALRSGPSSPRRR